MPTTAPPASVRFSTSNLPGAFRDRLIVVTIRSIPSLKPSATDVSCIVDEVGIVAGAADHDVGADSTVERIGTAEADEHVVSAKAADGVGKIGADENVGKCIASDDSHKNLLRLTLWVAEAEPRH